MLWGAGTAIGEVPPYYLSYKAAEAGTANTMMDEVQESVQTGSVLNRLPARRGCCDSCTAVLVLCTL